MRLPGFNGEENCMNKRAQKTVKSRNECRLDLLTNVQFLYELHLANLELESFNAQSKILPDFRSFAAPHGDAIETILKRSAYIGAADDVLSDYSRNSRDIT